MIRLWIFDSARSRLRREIEIFFLTVRLRDDNRLRFLIRESESTLILVMLFLFAIIKSDFRFIIRWDVDSILIISRIISIVSISFFLTISIFISISISVVWILSCLLRVVRLERLIIKITLMLLNDCSIFTSRLVVFWKHDFFCQSSKFFQFDSNNYWFDATNDFLLKIETQSLHQLIISLIFRISRSCIFKSLK
jgi:hypothetical protein